MKYNNIYWSACYPNLEEGSKVHIIIRPSGTTGSIPGDVKLLCLEINGTIGGDYTSNIIGELGKITFAALETHKKIKISEGWSAVPIKTMKHFVPEIEEEIEKFLVIAMLKYA